MAQIFKGVWALKLADLCRVGFFSKHLNILSASGGNGAKSYPTGFLPCGPQARHLLAVSSTSAKCEAHTNKHTLTLV